MREHPSTDSPGLCDRPTEYDNSATYMPPTLYAETNHSPHLPNEVVFPKAIAARFSQIRVLGQGSTGCVYAAYDTELDRMVAIKSLQRSPEGVAPRVFAQREARAIANLHHPGIVMLYDWITNDEEAWLILEFISGVSLNEHIASVGPLPAEEAIKICIQVCEAVQYAHDQGVWHLDIKPGNILLADGIVKVTDFGIALRLDQDKTGYGWGTPGYAAPEQLAGRPLPQSDVYAIAALLWALLTGSIKEGVVSLHDSHAWKHVPPYLRPVLRSALATRPQVRPVSPQALASVLRMSEKTKAPKDTLIHRIWDTMLAGVWGGGVTALVSGVSPIAIIAAGKRVWLGVTLAVLGGLRPSLSGVLALLALMGALLWRVPTLGVLLAMTVPLLVVCARLSTRSFLLVAMSPLFYSLGMGYLIPVLAGALLNAPSAIGTAVVSALVSGAILNLLNQPLTQSYFSAASTALPLPTLFRQFLALFMQISPRDIIITLIPALWRGATSPLSLGIIAISAASAAGVAWGKLRLGKAAMAGWFMLMLVIYEAVRMGMGGFFLSPGRLFLNYFLAYVVIEAAPGRIEGNLAMFRAWYSQRFPKKIQP